MSGDLILRGDGQPFKSESAAKMQAGKLSKSGVKTIPIPVEGGFALKKAEEVSEDSVVEKAPDTSMRKRPDRKKLGQRGLLDYEGDSAFKFYFQRCRSSIIVHQISSWGSQIHPGFR